MTEISNAITGAIDDFNNAKETVRRRGRQIVGLITGHLREIDPYASDLRRLKRELRDFDMTTGTWKR